jgi:coatomer protein complex subunit alpha (xenin)
VRQHDFNTQADNGLLSVRKLGSAYVQPKTLAYNPAERSVLITTSSEGGMFELSSLPRDTSGEVKDSSTDGKRGPGAGVVFVARNRFAVLDKANQVRE